MIVEHLLRDTKYKAMLIPIGDYKNLSIAEAEEGSVFETIDDPPKRVELIAKATIPSEGVLANAVSMLLYGAPIRTVFKVMKKSWQYDIHHDQILFLIVKEVMEPESSLQYNVAHLFAEEIVVPWIAISNNISFMMNKPKTIITADFVEAKIIARKEIHILSDEGIRVTKRLYGIPVDTLLKRWYSKYPEISSLHFVYLKLERFVYGTIIDSKELPAKDN